MRNEVMKKISTALSVCLFISISSVNAIEPITAYEFDYPIGDRGYDAIGNIRPLNERISSFGSTYNVDRNEEYNFEKGYAANNSRSGTNGSGSNWFVISDTGNFVNLKFTKGLHPGEDWNYGSKGDDAGKPIYAIADGVVDKISKVYTDENKAGWQIIIKHKLPDSSYVYSVYMHLTSANKTNGKIVSKKSNFTIRENTRVDRGVVIARLATDMTFFGEHLHFEIRNNNYSGSLYPNDNGNGYYSDAVGTKRESLTKSQVLNGFNLMRKDGILDPSDFIDDHRDIWFWTGNGSIISHHAENPNNSFGGSRANTNDNEYPYAITRDVTVSHVKTQKPNGFFQWQVGNNCDRLTIDYDYDPDSLVSNQEKFASITVGSWGTRQEDVTFENVSLPFTIGESNTKFTFSRDGSGWYVISVGLRNGVSSSKRILATCTNQSVTSYSKKLVKGQSVIIDGYQWNGNASIISRIFKNSANITQSVAPFGDWPYGAFKDVTFVHKSQYKPVVFFQWMSSDVCKEITIDAPSLSSKEKKVKLGVKDWNDNAYSDKITTLPIVLNSNNRLWSVIRVAFEKPVTKDARINATCKGF